MIVEHIQSIFSPEHGGPMVSLRGIALAQKQYGLDVRVRVLEGFRGVSPALRLNAGIDQRVFQVNFPQISGRSSALKRFLGGESSPHIYHLHGSWHLAQKYGADEARRRGIPYVVEMMGSFQPEELERKPWRKRLFRSFFQDRLLHEAACIHTNSEMEAGQLKNLGFEGPFAPIPVGFDVKEAVEDGQMTEAYIPEFARGWAEGDRFVLFLARVHKHKGIELLLEAWRRIAGDFKATRLIIVGAGNAAYTKALIDQTAHLQQSARVQFLGYVSTIDKIWLNRNAWVYCLPSYSENYGATIQDALGYGTPVITTNRTPWIQLEKKGVGWLAEPRVESLLEKLDMALRVTPGQRAEMGNKARLWIREDFCLAEVINKQVHLYKWLCGEANRPDFIISR